MSRKANSHILLKNLKDNYKVIPFNVTRNELGNIKYLPPVSKEWKNSIYVFNPNNLKNLPVYDININNIIKGYFSLYFNYKFINNQYQPRRLLRLSLNKIFVSKAELKHTNSKIKVTISTYNREKLSLQKKLTLLHKNFYNRIFSWLHQMKYKKNFLIGPLKSEDEYSYISKAEQKDICIPNSGEYYLKLTKEILYKELAVLRKYKLRLNLNKYKFEEEFLYKLSGLLSKIYNKRIEFNIINLKSIVFHSDIFTKILGLKIKNRRANVLRMMSIVLNKAVLPNVNRIMERSNLVKNIDLDVLENKFRSLNLNNLIQKDFNQVLNKLYPNVNITSNLYEYLGIYNAIFNLIKYKNMGGIRLEVKGRLTRRYRADRALFKVKWKGGLKNIDSSFKGLSTVNMRGHIKSNLEYSIFRSKRRIGAFAVKGWLSGK